MANKVEDLVNVILDSYKECDITARIDEETGIKRVCKSRCMQRVQ